MGPRLYIKLTIVGAHLIDLQMQFARSHRSQLLPFPNLFDLDRFIDAWRHKS